VNQKAKPERDEKAAATRAQADSDEKDEKAAAAPAPSPPSPGNSNQIDYTNNAGNAIISGVFGGGHFERTAEP